MNLEKICLANMGGVILPSGNFPQSIQNRRKLAENQGSVIRFERDSSFEPASFYQSSAKALATPYDNVILSK